MDIHEAIRQRHSVRRYTGEPIPSEILRQLQAEIAACNKESGLNMQLVTDEPEAFDGFMAHYGHFSGVSDYIAIVGKKGSDLSEKCGYYGERVVLKAQQLGLNTCWVALTYSKKPDKYVVKKGEKMTVVISVGYGEKPGHNRKSKTAEEVSNITDNSPEWFRKGVEAALLAPTAMNQQKFYLTYRDGKVSAKANFGFYTKMDLGIVKYHFEIGAGKENFSWK